MCMPFLLFKTNVVIGYFCLFLEQFKVHSKIEQKVQRFPIYLCPHTCIASPIITVPARVVHLLELMTLHWYACCNHAKSIFTLQFTVGIVHSVALDKCVVSCIHHYGITQSIFTVLKILCSAYLFPPPPLATTDLFTASTVLPLVPISL